MKFFNNLGTRFLASFNTLIFLDRALFTSQEATEDDPLEGAKTLKKVLETHVLFLIKSFRQLSFLQLLRNLKFVKMVRLKRSTINKQ